MEARERAVTLAAGFVLGAGVICLFNKLKAGAASSKACTDYKSKEFNGVPVMPLFDVNAIQDIMAKGSFSLRKTDIVIATYPKCGTTWMQQIVLTLLAGGDGSLVKRPMDMSPWIELSKGLWSDSWEPDASTQKTQPPRRVLKTHSPAQLSMWAGGVRDMPKGAKIIVVTRNPYDAVVSHWHHTLDVPFFGFKGSFHYFLTDIWLPGKAESGSFWEWHSSWWKEYQSQSANILWLSYEEMKAQPEQSIKKVAQFCEIEASDDVLDAVAGASSFTTMQNTATEEDAKKAAAGGFVKKNHIRVGKSGGWKSTFTVEEKTIMDAHHDAECLRLSLPLYLFPS